MAHRYDERYERDRDRGRGYARDDRGLIERAGDELRSWFGDEQAERRRRLDERERWRHERPERGGAGERWEEPERWRGEPTRWRGDADRWRGDGGREERYGAGYSGWNEPAYRDRPAPGYGYGDRWSGDSRWRSGGHGWTAPTEARSGHESRGIYEDTRGRVHQFSHGADASYAGRGPKGYRRSDERVREDVCERLTDDGRIDASEVEVTVNNGEVTLSGLVHSRAEKRHAEDAIDAIPGVRDVHNNLRVAGWNEAPTPAAAPTMRR